MVETEVVGVSDDGRPIHESLCHNLNSSYGASQWHDWKCKGCGYETRHFEKFIMVVVTAKPR